MPVINAAGTLQRADDLASNFTGGSIVVLEGATVLATHPIASWATVNVGEDAKATPSVSDVNASATGTADAVLMVNGGVEYDVTDSVTITQPEYVAGQNATVPSLEFVFNSVIA
ncbi:hypothetical protein vBAmaSR9Y2_15 [Alteromonas phage vB_AmaS-R9Y2]|nr:hypothetical protein vBAmaSR9Y2_15 [Alteromonas phage vB_AmaS-R9Y2]